MRFEGASSVPRLTKALFFMGSKGHVRHSFGVFFAWHGLESCWCLKNGLFGSEADENLNRSSGIYAPGTPSGAKTRVLRARPCLCLAFGCFGTVPKHCFFLWVPKVTCGILSACFLLGMGWNLAGVSVFLDLKLTRIWVAIVRNPRSWHPFWCRNLRSSGL